jgi:hypothetical protein
MPRTLTITPAASGFHIYLGNDSSSGEPLLPLLDACVATRHEAKELILEYLDDPEQLARTILRRCPYLKAFATPTQRAELIQEELDFTRQVISEVITEAEEAIKLEEEKANRGRPRKSR